MWPSLETTPKTISIAGNFIFINLGIITLIGREHDLYSGASLILLIEHWDLYTTGQLVDGLQQKKKTSFH